MSRHYQGVIGTSSSMFTSWREIADITLQPCTRKLTWVRAVHHFPALVGFTDHDNFACSWQNEIHRPVLTRVLQPSRFNDLLLPNPREVTACSLCNHSIYTVIYSNFAPQISRFRLLVENSFC